MIKSKFKDFKVKQLTSLLLLLVIVPFLVFGSLPYGNSMISYGYDIFFITVIGATLTYTIYELTSFVINKKENVKSWAVNFILLATLANFIFFFISSKLIMFGSPYDTAQAQALINNFDWLMIMIIIFASMFIYMLLTLTLNPDSRDNALLFFKTILITIFFTSLVFIAKYFSYSILFLPILICVFSDTMAYIGGKAYGKTKPFPTISPNKTTEGLITGFLSGVAIGLGWYYLVVVAPWTTASPIVTETMTQGFSIVLIIIMSIASPFGDLMFSKMKRSYGKKDFGSFLPGHGGILDRVDSHILVTSLTSLILLLAVLV